MGRCSPSAGGGSRTLPGAGPGTGTRGPPCWAGSPARSDHRRCGSRPEPVQPGADVGVVAVAVVGLVTVARVRAAVPVGGLPAVHARREPLPPGDERLPL